jgi:hypothetical protein
MQCGKLRWGSVEVVGYRAVAPGAGSGGYRGKANNVGQGKRLAPHRVLNSVPV